ncbi:MAG: hypothetical protein ACI30W_05025 [Muribaculaceae bacterium]
MTNDAHISEIRYLLSLYYDGGCTLADRQRLAALLADTAIVLPADIAADAAPFLALAAAADTTTPTPPAWLEDRLKAITVTAERPRRRKRIAAWLSVGATAAIALLPLFVSNEAEPDAAAPTPPIVAQVHITDAHDSAAEHATLTAEVTTPKAAEPPRHLTATPRRATEARNYHDIAHADLPHSTIVITDPDQAAYITANAIDVLARTLDAQMSILYK